MSNLAIGAFVGQTRFNGTACENLGNDIITVGSLLGGVPVQEGGGGGPMRFDFFPPGGFIDPALVKRIVLFQSVQHGKGTCKLVDGVIKPQGETMGLLNRLCPAPIRPSLNVLRVRPPAASVKATSFGMILTPEFGTGTGTLTIVTPFNGARYDLRFQALPGEFGFEDKDKGFLTSTMPTAVDKFSGPFVCQIVPKGERAMAILRLTVEGKPGASIGLLKMQEETDFRGALFGELALKTGR